MSDNDKMATRFTAEMQQKFETLVEWAIANCPERALTDKDFNPCRQQIAQLTDRLHDQQQDHEKQGMNQQSMNEQNKAIPEPSDSGPQYINVTPSPWP